MNSSQPKVLIVILNYSTFEMTINLIKELHADLDYENYSIMVVDNCSPNESSNILEVKSKELDFIFYANKVNSGYAAGNNIGIRYGIEHGYDYSWILNNDVELREKSVLQHMINIIDNDDEIGCIGPKIYSSDGIVCGPYCRRLSFLRYVFGTFSEKKYRQQFINISRKVYRVYGCCMLLKNKVMSEVDCMDERTFLYGEEDILAERMLAKGYRSYYDAEVSVTHNESSTIKKMSADQKKFQVKVTRVSREIYLKDYRHFPLPARWLCHCIRSIVIYLR